MRAQGGLERKKGRAKHETTVVNYSKQGTPVELWDGAIPYSSQ